MSFRHSGWHRDRKRIHTALAAVFPASKRLERFATCGSNAWVIRDDEQPDRFAIVADHCHDRFCRPCARFRGTMIAHNVATYLDTRRYRFLTLTIKNTGLTLQQGVNKLYAAFAKLRRSVLWNSKVTGGCAICEIKPKDYGPGWHPHLHCLIQGKYLPKEPLRKLWYAITGDSYVLKIKDGNGPEKAASYVCKYITKPFDDGTTRSTERLLEAIKALHGRRLVTTFGTWRGAGLTKYRPRGVWVKVCTLGRLRHHAEHGSPTAIELLAHLSEKMPYSEVPRPRGRPPPVPDGSPAPRSWVPCPNAQSVGPTVVAGGQLSLPAGSPSPATGLSGPVKLPTSLPGPVAEYVDVGPSPGPRGGPGFPRPTPGRQAARGGPEQGGTGPPGSTNGSGCGGVVGSGARTIPTGLDAKAFDGFLLAQTRRPADAPAPV